MRPALSVLVLPRLFPWGGRRPTVNLPQGSGSDPADNRPLCLLRPDLEHLLPWSLPDPPYGHLLHLHGLDLQRLLLQVFQHLRLFLECPAHVQEWHVEVSLHTELGHSVAIQVAWVVVSMARGGSVHFMY